MVAGLRRFLILGALALFCIKANGEPSKTQPSANLSEPALKSTMVFSGPELRNEALEWIKERDNTDMVATLIYALRYVEVGRKRIARALTALTGANHGEDWFQWMLWQESHPEIVPFDGFEVFLAQLFGSIDPEFRVFLYPQVAHEIRLSEITWGGVQKDGIPALTNPDLVGTDDAGYLNDDEPVFGVEINGDTRAYPYRIMDWHEMFNDVIGGVPVSLAYCTLCGSGILFDTRVEGREEPFVFGSSGFLYRSNKLMYDQQTHSLWNQFTGKPVVGELTGSGIALKVLPLVTTTWGKWRAKHPDTKVLKQETGFSRDYRPGRPYGEYFASPELMFPALHRDKRLKVKDQVFGLRISGSEKAWPLTTFKGGRVINDQIGVIPIVLVGDAKSRSVRAYRSGGREFRKQKGSIDTLNHDGEEWAVEEAHLSGPGGATLPRLPGHLAYWFAWRGYLQDAALGEPQG